jgi:AraC family transcriptional regulator of adaptative response / DNA-3-methyladenine glycosylase II
MTVVADRDHFHRPACPAAPADGRRWPSAVAALAAGRAPCARCEAAGAAPETADPLLRRFVRRAGAATDLDTLAAHCGVRRRDLDRAVRGHWGAAPARVRAWLRARAARACLDRGDLDAGALAPLLGFRDRAALGTGLARHGLGQPGVESAVAATVFLPAVPPFDPAALVTFLADRVIPALERVTEDDGVAYTRAWATAAGVGTVTLHPEPDGVALTVRGPGVRRAGRWPLADLVARADRVLDLAAPTEAIAAVLGRDALLAGSLRRRPGHRVPGGWSPFELVVRAVLGQQVSIAAARTHAERLVALCPGAAGADGLRPFPTPAALADADLSALRLPGARKRAVTTVAAAVAEGRVDLDGDPAQVRAGLLALRGIGPWTVDYVCMRGLKDRDAFPDGDLVVRQALAPDGDLPSPAATRARADAWRPYRAYGALHLWALVADRRAGVDA